ncbi:hypothetical protein H105_00090 [Trichophyton soudanense CBS 452.61]|uniref:Uncharacterized protein n=1 Tax=Trichophyton soudanense CBS 452.61 TaxID=1215331 RepID=A0A022Y823_TRISD|nr:hypothetical protein H105_00090 [Trichophyton soudanense CBS 452.61]
MPCGGVFPGNDLYFPVPTVEFLSCLDELGLPRDCCGKSQLENPQTIAMACLILIEAITCPVELSLTDSKASLLRESFNYGLHFGVRLWKAIFAWFDANTVAVGEESLTSLLVEFVSFSRKLCSYSTRLSSRIDQKVLLPLFQCVVVDLVDPEKLKRSNELQQVLAEFLMEVIRLSQSSAGVEGLVEELFFYPLSDIGANLDFFQTLHQSLQVNQPYPIPAATKRTNKV